MRIQLLIANVMRAPLAPPPAPLLPPFETSHAFPNPPQQHLRVSLRRLVRTLILVLALIVRHLRVRRPFVHGLRRLHRRRRRRCGLLSPHRLLLLAAKTLERASTAARAALPLRPEHLVRAFFHDIRRQRAAGGCSDHVLAGDARRQRADIAGVAPRRQRAQLREDSRQPRVPLIPRIRQARRRGTVGREDVPALELAGKEGDAGGRRESGEDELLREVAGQGGRGGHQGVDVGREAGQDDDQAARVAGVAEEGDELVEGLGREGAAAAQVVRFVDDEHLAERLRQLLARLGRRLADVLPDQVGRRALENFVRGQEAQLVEHLAHAARDCRLAGACGG